MENKVMDSDFIEPATNAEKACHAISARITGVWDNPCLTAFGPLSTDTVSDIQEILEFYGMG